MENLRAMAGGGAPHHHRYGPSCLALDPSKGGLALQEANTQHSLQQLSYDPSFAERAAKYSTFGNANYSQRFASTSFDTGRLREALENESAARADHAGAGAIPRSASFSSQYSEDETTKTTTTKCETTTTTASRRRSPGVGEATSEGVGSQENSSGSGSAQAAAAAGAAGPAKKRKGKESSNNSDSKSEQAATEQTSLKRQRSGSKDGALDVKPKAEGSGSENSGDSSPRSLKAGATSKPPQDQLPKQDYIHVRARRGQATDSHSLAERVRREKISERMKFLQDLVPGCSKVTGKAVMLDEIINYVQSLQRQIEFLSMKLAAVNPRLDYNYDQLLGKDLLQSRSPETTLLGPDPLGYGDLHCHGQVPMPPLPSGCSLDMRGVEGLCDAYLRRSMSVPSMPSLVSDDHFSDPLSQAVGLCGDLQSVVEMGFVQGRHGSGLGTRLSHGPSACLPGKLKVEL